MLCYEMENVEGKEGVFFFEGRGILFLGRGAI